MKDFIILSSAPIDEDCVQVTSEKPYIEEMKAECRRFKKLLEELFPNPPQSCYFAIKRFEHDFGGYYEVVVYYDDEDEVSCDYAFNVEDNLPLTWE